LKRNIQLLIGAILMVALMWFLFRDTDWARVWSDLAGANKLWLSVSAFFVFASFFLRALRWHFVVRSTKRVDYWLLYDATQIGFFANFTLPARAGEAIRALVLARGAAIPFTKCVAFVALDRVTDLFGLILILSFSMLVYRPEKAIQFPKGFELPEWAAPMLEPDAIQNGAILTVIVMLGIAATLLTVYLRYNWVLAVSDAVLGRVSTKFAASMNSWIGHFADGLHVFRSPRDMGGALVFSTSIWITGAISIQTGLLGFGVDAPWYAGCVVLSVLSVVIALPGTPGFVGTFHLGVMLGLFITAPGISADSAKAMAIFAHLVNLVPICLTGIHSLHRQHVGLLQLEEEAEQLEEKLEESADTQTPPAEH